MMLVSRQAQCSADFAVTLARQYRDQGGSLENLFGAFVGAMAYEEPRLADICLMALDDLIQNRQEHPDGR